MKLLSYGPEPYVRDAARIRWRGRLATGKAVIHPPTESGATGEQARKLENDLFFTGIQKTYGVQRAHRRFGADNRT